MVRGLYTNSASMQLLIDKMDAVGNNIANVSTNGYRRKGVFLRQLIGAEQALERNNLELRERADEPLIRNTPDAHVHALCCAPRGGQMHLTGEIATYTDYTPAGLHETGNPLDIALGGDGFFSIATANGTAYTRDGQFSLDSNGYLVDSHGRYVQGEGGPIQITGGSVEIGEEGEVIVDNEVVTRLSIRTFNTDDLVRVEDSLFVPADGAAGTEVEHPIVKQGYLELSNVNIVNEMVDMISVQRHYEANAKVIRAQDETLQKAVNEIAK